MVMRRNGRIFWMDVSRQTKKE